MRLNIIFNAQKKITYAGWFIYVFWVPCDQSVISINYSFHMNEWIEAQFKVLRNILSCLIIKFLVHLWYATQWTRFSFFFFFCVVNWHTKENENRLRLSAGKNEKSWLHRSNEYHLLFCVAILNLSQYYTINRISINFIAMGNKLHYHLSKLKHA